MFNWTATVEEFLEPIMNKYKAMISQAPKQIMLHFGFISQT